MSHQGVQSMQGNLHLIIGMFAGLQTDTHLASEAAVDRYVCFHSRNNEIRQRQIHVMHAC
jgi:hypothetical protein